LKGSLPHAFVSKVVDIRYLIVIAESCDRAELGRLLQLLLGCAVNCGHKQQYITVIMGMEESVQRVIMQAIQVCPKIP